jgi:divalent metal cation (Fe/Co/Zn/Cd) transporter
VRSDTSPVVVESFSRLPIEIACVLAPSIMSIPSNQSVLSNASRDDTPAPQSSRRRLLRCGIGLSLFVIAWNVVEGIVAVAAGIIANSVALISFGIDSSVEVLSATAVTWRLWVELHGNPANVEALERRTAKVTGGLLLLLGVYIAIDAGRRLLGWGEPPDSSIVGIVLTTLSLIAMPLLGWWKLRIAASLGSGAMRADAYETIACAWLSLAALVGLALNATLGWTWADPAAALVILPLVIREGLEAFGEDNDGEL